MADDPPAGVQTPPPPPGKNVQSALIPSAPDTPQDTAFFFCAGNATDKNWSPSGDFIFTARETVLDLTTPVKAVTWGAVKKRYRN